MIFFSKLHSMIKNESHSGAIDWLPPGDGFVILLKNRFSSEILPRWFGQAKYTSFTRRLKRWGFRRISNSGAYHHPNFHRGMGFDLEEEHVVAPSKPSNTHGLPLKKRAKWMSSSPRHGSSDHRSDINVMPELMRNINRQKRKERKEEDQEYPQAKKPAVHQGGFIKRSNTLEQSVEAAQTLASLGQREPPRESLDILATRNRSMIIPPFYHPGRPAAALREEQYSSHSAEASLERALANLQSKVRRMGHDDLNHCTGNTADFPSLLTLRRVENYNSLGLCQPTSDSRVPIHCLQQRHNPAFNRAA